MASFYVSKLVNIISRSSPITGRLFSTTPYLSSIKNVTVIGAGIMGSGIAQVAAQVGCTVTLVDVSEKILEKSKSSVQKSLKRVSRKKFPDDSQAEAVFMEDTFKKITFTKDGVAKSVKSADLVVETVNENTELKKKIFKEMEAHSPSSALFATDTSSVPLSELASVIRRKDKFAGLHFFNPVQVMKLLEFVQLPDTSQESFDLFMEFCKKLGKMVVVCKDTPGFVVNRLLVPYCFEALRMLERGDASMPDIDTAMRLGAGYPMGPFELIDYIGLDTMKSIVDGWHQRFPDDDLYRPSPVLDQLVASGNLGRKTGEGFYKYP